MPPRNELLPTLRLLIGAAIVILVWVLYFVRVTLEVGPMHDQQGNQAPALHYLIGAIIVTSMVALWIIVRGAMSRTRQ
jgi:hypothetical protein